MVPAEESRETYPLSYRRLYQNVISLPSYPPELNDGARSDTTGNQ